MRQILSLMLGALLACLPCPTSRADTLVLKNGDRLTGTYVGQEDGWLLFQSALLGDLRVDANRATIVTTSSERSTPAPAAATRNVAAGRDAVSPRATPDAGWKRQLELGLSAQDGAREQSQLSLRIEADHDTSRGSVNLLLSHHYGKSDGYLVTDATQAHALLTRNLNDQLFVRGATRFDRDGAIGLAHDAEQSLGLGYTVLGRRNLKLAIGGGAAMRNRRTDGEAAEWDGLIDAFGRLKCEFNERFSLSQDFSVTASPSDRDDYQLKSQTALVNQLTEILRMTLRYEFEYYSAAPSGISARQRLVTAIGCAF